MRLLVLLPLVFPALLTQLTDPPLPVQFMVSINPPDHPLWCKVATFPLQLALGQLLPA
jgi:hypothetical protein